MQHIDSVLYNEQCRNMAFNGHDFLITEVGTSEQDKLRLGVNCDGFGRIRVFKQNKDTDWISNPLPFSPYAFVMGKTKVEELPIQVFQLAKCNLNCWWCFLPDEYKKCKSNHSRWFSVDELLELYMRDARDKTSVIDLSGGNPELVPEFVLSFMMGLEKLKLSDVYLWSDDVLTTDYLFTKLSQQQIDYMSNYSKYGKVACFKGIDDESFLFNTCSNVSLFREQLIMAKKYIDIGFDIYFYVVLTVPDITNISSKISYFFDCLQRISHYLPLRVIPIKIKEFSTNSHRISTSRKKSITNQFKVLNVWNEELSKRYSTFELTRDISLQPIK